MGLGKQQSEPRREEVANYIANWTNQWKDDFYLMEKGAADINSEGLRDYEHAVENTGGLTRVVCLGDSVTFGYLLARTNSYPAILEEELRGAGLPAEVFNIALPGWCVRQERKAYTRIAQKYKPRHVFLGLCLNDIAEMQNNLYKPSPALAWAFKNSRLMRALMRPQATEIHRVEELFDNPDARSVRNGWRLLFNDLISLAGEIRRDGTEFTLLVFPFRMQVETNAPPPLPQQDLKVFTDRAGIRSLDLLPVLSPLGTNAFVDYDHLSRDGAEAVARAIMESGVIQP